MNLKTALVNIPHELKSLKKYVPEFRYFSIIENRYGDKDLKRIGNIVSSIFLLENRDSGDFLSTIEQVKKNLKGKDIGAIKTYLVWFKKYLEVNATIEEAQESIKQIKSEKEAAIMLAKTIEKVRQNFINEGIQLGIQQGMQKGMQKGMQQGVQQGMQKGIQQGMRKKAIETAVSLVKEGMSIKKTAEITGLSEREVSKLKKSS